MLEAINNAFNAQKRAARDHELIMEAALDVEEVLPGSDEEEDDMLDADSVPDEVYNKIDKALDDLISKSDYDDSSTDELVDDDIDEDEISDEELEVVITEACGPWLDDENIGHPDTSRRTNPKAQLKFNPTGTLVQKNCEKPTNESATIADLRKLVGD